jgi:hypothetical protein
MGTDVPPGKHIRLTSHPTEGGEVKTFVKFLMRLIPDKKERKWMWHWAAHKARRPWVPMVAIVMVAEKFGSGRIYPHEETMPGPKAWLTELNPRAASLFDGQAGCRSCHDGKSYTDQEKHKFSGTLPETDTPSLIGLAAAAAVTLVGGTAFVQNFQKLTA